VKLKNLILNRDRRFY